MAREALADRKEADLEELENRDYTKCARPRLHGYSLLPGPSQLGSERRGPWRARSR